MDFFKKNLFKICVICLCILVFSFFAFRSNFVNSSVAENNNKTELSVFVQDGCVHCMNAEKWLKTNPFSDSVNVVYYNLKNKMNSNLLNRYAVKFDIPRNKVGTPIFVIKDDYILGFSEGAKEELKILVEKYK